jgi:hypothetical protein
MGFRLAVAESGAEALPGEEMTLDRGVAGCLTSRASISTTTSCSEVPCSAAAVGMRDEIRDRSAESPELDTG